MSSPYMPFYVGDYLRDTQHLTAEQHGAYLLLLFACWTLGALPDDERELARIAKLPIRKWRFFASKFHLYFARLEDGLWHQKRIDRDRQHIDAIKSARRNAGLLSAAKRQQTTNKRSTRARVPEPSYLKKPRNLGTNSPRPRAREAPIGRKRNRKNGALADIEAKPPRFATIERSSRPAIRQPSNAKSRLMQKVARWLPEDAVAGFWAAMMGPDAQQTLDRAVEQMRASGWEDRG